MSDHITSLRKPLVAKLAAKNTNSVMLDYMPLDITFLIELPHATDEVASIHCQRPAFRLLWPSDLGVLVLRELQEYCIKL